MRESTKIAYNKQAYSRIYDWFRLISVTSGAQVIVQVTGLLSGILIIRLLPTQQYAYYTLANSMLSTMTMLSDCGVSIGVMSQGGKVWQSKEKLGEVLSTGLNIRKGFGIISLLITIPILFYLLIHHGDDSLGAFLIVIALIPAFFAALSDSVLETIPKLHQDIHSLQKNQVSVGIGRLVMNSIGLFLLPFPFVAVLSNGFPRLYGNIKLKKITSKYVDIRQKPNAQIRKEILSMVKKILPGVVFYCLSGQLTIWLISFFGKTSSIAQLGALGRLAVLLNILSISFSTLFVPRFARLPANSEILLSRFLQLLGVAIMVCICVVAVFVFFPNQFLFVLGSQYKGLSYELILTIIGSCISVIWGIVFNLYSSRGWVLHPLVSISLSVVAIVVGIFFFDVSSLSGILYMNIFIATIELIYHTFYGIYRIMNLRTS